MAKNITDVIYSLIEEMIGDKMIKPLSKVKFQYSEIWCIYLLLQNKGEMLGKLIYFAYIEDGSTKEC